MDIIASLKDNITIKLLYPPKLAILLAILLGRGISISIPPHFQLIIFPTVSKKSYFKRLFLCLHEELLRVHHGVWLIGFLRIWGGVHFFKDYFLTVIVGFITKLRKGTTFPVKLSWEFLIDRFPPSSLYFLLTSYLLKKLGCWSCSVPQSDFIPQFNINMIQFTLNIQVG